MKALGLNIVGFTRPLLDLHVRRRLSYDPRVRILEETETLRLLPRADGGVCGIACRTRRAGARTLSRLFHDELGMTFYAVAGSAPRP